MHSIYRHNSLNKQLCTISNISLKRNRIKVTSQLTRHRTSFRHRSYIMLWNKQKSTNPNLFASIAAAMWLMLFCNKVSTQMETKKQKTLTAVSVRQHESSPPSLWQLLLRTAQHEIFVFLIQTRGPLNSIRTLTHTIHIRRKSAAGHQLLRQTAHPEFMFNYRS